MTPEQHKALLELIVAIDEFDVYVVKKKDGIEWKTTMMYWGVILSTGARCRALGVRFSLEKLCQSSQQLS